MSDPSTFRHTPLHALHLQHGAKMVPFAGYEMPVNYPDGIIKEHRHTRQFAGLFDVSHMGQIDISGVAPEKTAAALEALMPMDILSLPPYRQKYALLTNPEGGIIDDLMVQNLGQRFVLVVNAACKANDFAHLQPHFDGNAQLQDDRALLALQGPAAAAVMARCCDDDQLATMQFMHVREWKIDGVTCIASRSGYTGEDGFELSMAAAHAESVARRLLADDTVQLIGLGARDSLRLEAGLCLYGHDITAETTPVEAGLNWALSKERRNDGERAGGFPGADIILPQLPNNISRRRVGLLPEGRAPVREGADLLDADGNSIGLVTSGGFSPSLGHPVSMGYVTPEHATTGTKLQALVRGKPLPLTVVKLPFVAANFYR